MREKNEKYRYEIPKERQKKSFFSYSFFCMFGESKWKTKWYATR